MTNTTGKLKRFLTALAVCLSAATAGAQDLAEPFVGAGAGEAIPRPTDSTPTPNIDLPVSVDESVEMALGRPNVQPTGSPFERWDGYPAVVETTGTSLDRGYWYSQVEAVVMVRQWNRQRLPLLADGVNSLRSLTLGRSTPGREGSVRFTLGHFLFRDESNRDHAMEFTVLGGGEFGQNSEAFADNVDDPRDLVNNPATDPILIVPTGVDLAGDVTFTGAESSFVQYDSRFNSFELNYSASTRLGRDRMEMLPSGQWVRRANSGFTYQFLAGARYIDLTENLDWTANNISNNVPTTPLDGETGSYLIRTSNDIFGVQLGFGAAYGGPRFSLSSLTKFGILANDIKTRSSVTFTDPTTGDQRTDLNFSNANRADTLTLMTEFSVVGRYHIRPNLSWRTGYHLLYITATALAPHQIDFEPNDASIASTGDVFYHGISTGLDFYW